MATRGRPPETGVTRGEVLCARFDGTKVEQIDAVRGSKSRSAFVREAVDEKLARGGRKK